MASDYISRETALACFHDWIDHYGHEHTADEMTEYHRIEDLPAADVRPVVHSRWIYDCERTLGDGWTYRQYHCEKCGRQEIGGCQNYCPNCGADMRQEVKK